MKKMLRLSATPPAVSSGTSSVKLFTSATFQILIVTSQKDENPNVWFIICKFHVC